MKVILLGNLSGKNPLLIELALNLDIHGHDVILADFISSKIYDLKDHKTKPIESFPFIKYILKIKYFRRLFIKRNNLNFIKRTIKLGDCVNIHFCTPMYVAYIDGIKDKGGHVISTIWGSEYLRANNTAKAKLYPLFAKSDAITMVEGVRKAFINEYPELSEKIHTTFFGLQKLEKPNSSISVEEFKLKYNISLKKILITIGNNGIASQQHIKVLNELDKLDENLKEAIQIVIPATYGLKEKYHSTLMNSLNDIAIEYTILNQSLNNDEFIALHKSTDILIFFQKTDAFSAFFSESIFYGAIVIAGDWLPYDIYDEWEIDVTRANFNNLTDTVKYSIINLSQIKNNNIINNPARVLDKLAWKNAIHRWAEVYKVN